ncbi:MAG: MCE family protein [Candidatus Tectomicrobia bacterium]|uniref:MCE family protein n=1 Tax=Tectimicrobiota bacterium TaxID=2528274 RepID=A0A932FVN2_UNCTE|nr:MCE family protein [Candidatus Tectomicrobia bacterium]
MRGSFSTEAWVGLVTLVAVALLFVATLTIGGFELFGRGEGQQVVALFNNAAGLEKKALVKQAGVTIGTVESLALVNGKARVTMRVRPGVQIRRDAQASIRMPGVFGEKYVEISPGSPDQPFLPPGGTIAGVGAADLETVMARVNAISEDLQAFSHSLRNVLGSEEAQKNLKETIENFHAISAKLDQALAGNRLERLLDSTQDLQTLAADARTLIPEARSTLQSLRTAGDTVTTTTRQITQGKGTLARLINDEALYQDVRGLMTEAKTAMGEARVALRDLSEVGQKLSSSKGTLGRLMNDESLYHNLNTAATEGRQAFTTLNQISARVAKGEGTLGKLVNDDSLYVEAQKTLKKVNRAMEGVSEQAPITTLGTVLGLLF